MASFDEVVSTFLRAPDAEGYGLLCAQVQLVDNYDPNLNVASAAVPLLEEKQFDQVIDAIRQTMPGGFASPSVHLWLAEALEGLSQDEDAQFERYIAQALMAGLLSTGEGTEESPFKVMYVGDEYDVLMVKGKTVVGQSLAVRDGRQFDVLTSEDDEEFWFELTWFASDDDEEDLDTDEQEPEDTTKYWSF